MPSPEWLAALDPNVAYLGLIVALWSVVTIIYTPGTIFGEIISTIMTLAVLAVMVNQPVNWLAVVVIVAGVSSFLALPFMSVRYARFADLGLILQALGGLLLFSSNPVSPVMILMTVLIAWVYHRALLLPALRYHQLAESGDEGVRLLGAHGRVLRAIDPVGTVYVNGESWTARSTEPLLPETEVVVIQKVGLELHVQKAKRDETVANAQYN